MHLLVQNESPRKSALGVGFGPVPLLLDAGHMASSFGEKPVRFTLTSYEISCVSGLLSQKQEQRQPSAELHRLKSSITEYLGHQNMRILSPNGTMVKQSSPLTSRKA